MSTGFELQLAVFSSASFHRSNSNDRIHKMNVFFNELLGIKQELRLITHRGHRTNEDLRADCVCSSRTCQVGVWSLCIRGVGIITAPSRNNDCFTTKRKSDDNCLTHLEERWLAAVFSAPCSDQKHPIILCSKKEGKDTFTYMSEVDETMFVGNLISCLSTSRYVDSPGVGVDLLSCNWFQPENQQNQQAPKEHLHRPEPEPPCRGRRRRQRHGFS